MVIQTFQRLGTPATFTQMTTAFPSQPGIQRLWRVILPARAFLKASATCRPQSWQRNSCTHLSLSVFLRGVGCPAHCCRRGSQRGPSSWCCGTYSYPLHFRVLVSCSPQCAFLSEGCWVCESVWHLRLTWGCQMWFHLLFWGAGRGMLGFIWKLSLTWRQEVILRWSVHFF